MRIDHDFSPESQTYKPGLDTFREAVISSHFMHEYGAKAELEIYDDTRFAARTLEISAEDVTLGLIPALSNACNAFCVERAASAKRRAMENFWRYGLDGPQQVQLAHVITEVMFDRQFLRGPRDTCSRELVCANVRERIEAGLSIEMVIPALPFKFSSPLKARGRLPDLGEVNFILGLYEIAATIDIIYRAEKLDVQGQTARFTIVSDGSRFNRLVNEPDNVVDTYRDHLALWIETLGLDRWVRLLDYRALLRDRLPAVAWQAKDLISEKARADYSRVLWPLFNPFDMGATLRAAARVEPDPEYSNPEGRFVTLLKSLIYTINYRSLKALDRLPPLEQSALYRELTGHIFEPYTILSGSELIGIEDRLHSRTTVAITAQVKEFLRQSMLREAWAAAIDYIAEIKSDRELDQDPILACLPGHFRWSIHAKPGQLAVLTPSAFGTPVQAWAGAAVFKATKKNKIKLCSLPILALEGPGAIPVVVRSTDSPLSLSGQPLFYIYPDVAFSDFQDFLCQIRRSLLRKRAS